MMGSKSLREKILDLVSDAVSDLVYYDRKEDCDIGTEGIADAVKDQIISIDAMVEKFRIELTKAVR